MPVKEKRQYSTSFPRQTARFINFELTLRNGLYRHESETYALNMRYFNPDGSLLWEVGQQDRFIKFDTHANGYGWAEAGWWEAGTYQVEILIDGVKFAEGSFTIEEDRERVEHAPASMKLPPSPALEFVSLRFFESGRVMPVKEKRQYSTSFPHQAARFVSFELTMRNKLESERGTRVRVKTHFLNPDGSLYKRQEEDHVVYADKDSRPYQWGFGAEQPGSWIPGTYRVMIFIDGVEFAEESFTIE